MITTLIPMEDFVLQLRAKTTAELLKDIPNVFWDISIMTNKSAGEIANYIVANDAILWRIAGNYAKLLKQPPTLGMFVPCDAEGNVLKPLKFTIDGHPIYDGGLIYQQAKQNCLFEWFEVVKTVGEFTELMHNKAGLFVFDSASNVLSRQGIAETLSDLIRYNLALTQTFINKIYN